MGFAVTALLTVFAGLASAAAPSFAALLVMRALVGVGLGGAPVVFSLFMEFVPPPERGFWLIGVSVFWTAGSILEAGLAWVSGNRMGEQPSLFAPRYTSGTPTGVS